MGAFSRLFYSGNLHVDPANLIEVGAPKFNNYIGVPMKRIALEGDFQRRVQQKTKDVRKHSESERAEAAKSASEAIVALEDYKREPSAKEAASQAEADKREL